MTSAEIKLDLFRTIDQLKKNQLDEVLGLIKNYIHGQYSELDWAHVSSVERKALLDAKNSIRKNGGTEHSIVMKELRKRVANA